MDVTLNIKFSNVLLSKEEKLLYLEIFLQDPKLKELFSLIVKNSINKNNPGAIGITKEQLIKQHNFSKFIVDKLIAFLEGGCFIYFISKREAEQKGTYYNATNRGFDFMLSLKESK